MSDPRDGHAKGASAPPTSTGAGVKTATVPRRPSSKSQGKFLRRVVREKGLREGHYSTLRVLHDYANEHGEAWPTLGQLSGERLAGRSTVIERLGILQQAGLVWTIKAPERPKKGPLTALEALASTDKDTGQPVVIPNDGRSLYLVVDVASNVALARWMADVRSSGHPQYQLEASAKPAPTATAAAASSADTAASSRTKRSAPPPTETGRALFEALVRASAPHATLRGSQSLEDECAARLVKLGVTLEECAEMGAALARPVPGLLRKNKPVTHAMLADLATWQEKGSTEYTWRGLHKLVQHVRAERQRREAARRAQALEAQRAEREAREKAEREAREKAERERLRAKYPDLDWNGQPFRALMVATNREIEEQNRTAPLVPPPPDLDVQTSAPSMSAPVRTAPTGSSSPTKTGNDGVTR